MTKGPEPPGDPTSPSLPSAGDAEPLVRAEGAMFLVTDRSGDVSPSGARELGLFYRDTRHLSFYALRVARGDVLRLSAEASTSAHNQIDLMVSDLDRTTVLDDPQNFLHIRRRQLLDGELVEQITFTNFLPRSVSVAVTLAFDADFVDIFEVRGARRPRRGVAREPRVVGGDSIVFAYDGLDGARYGTSITFVTPPQETTATSARFVLAIDAGRSASIELAVRPWRDDEAREAPVRGSFASRARRLEEASESFRESSTRFTCDNALVQHFLARATSDLDELRVRFGGHTIVGAGIPWFCAPFGRDAILASYEALFLNPALAEQSLRTLAAYQGKKDDDVTEEEPGKIFHELRFGEMARTGEIPHSPYYGSIDSTPLFVILIDAAHRVTGNVTFLEELRAPLLAALEWIDRRSKSGTDLVTYERRSAHGLDNQGWKDSRAGVSFPDGRRAEPPIALVEVQGYCADAYRRGARVLAVLGDESRARTYAERARALSDLIEREMWIEQIGRYAFALDGRRRPLPTVVSNLGHLLWSRVPSKERAGATASLLLSSPSFSGFGVRTLASGQPVYNPLSYHNGTVWPHDNALIARGLSNYDLPQETESIFEALCEAMSFFRDHRLPELFCGIDRRLGPLVRYPVACSPQAWAAAAPFLLVQSLLGLHADAAASRLTIRNPRLPKSIGSLEIGGLRVGGSVVTIRFRRVGSRCHVDRLDVSGRALKTQIEID